MLDRLSFQRFCRLDGALHIPDARTLWTFRQRLAAGGLGAKAIFKTLSQQLQRHGYIPRGGQIVDASIVTAPITQANAQERETLNRGDKPEGWSKKRLAHTDQDARWTQKHGKSYYGYKLHGNVDARYELIRQIKVTRRPTLTTASNCSTCCRPPTRGTDCWPTAATTARPTARPWNNTASLTASPAGPSPGRQPRRGSSSTTRPSTAPGRGWSTSSRC
jgi:hypothetical protein